MNMERLMKLGAKALRIQGKKLPDKRFKDDSGEYVSFAQIADQIDVILEIMYNTHDTTFYVKQIDKNQWTVTRKGVK